MCLSVTLPPLPQTAKYNLLFYQVVNWSPNLVACRSSLQGSKDGVKGSIILSTGTLATVSALRVGGASIPDDSRSQWPKDGIRDRKKLSFRKPPSKLEDCDDR